MKKLLTMMVAGILTVTAQAAAFAEEADAPQIVEFSYENINPDLYDGAWLSTGYGFDLYLPADWNVLDISDIEGADENGIIFMAQDGEAGRSISISASEVEDLTDITILFDDLANTEGYGNLFYVDANGIPAVGFDRDEDKVSGLAFADTEGYLYTVMAAPADDEEFMPVVYNIFNSISLSETDEDEEATE